MYHWVQDITAGAQGYHWVQDITAGARVPLGTRYNSRGHVYHWVQGITAGGTKVPLGPRFLALAVLGQKIIVKVTLDNPFLAG